MGDGDECKMMQQHHFHLFADYHQFYVQDDDPSFGDLSKAWTEEAVARLMAVAPHVVSVGTARNTDVLVTVEITTCARSWTSKRGIRSISLPWRLIREGSSSPVAPTIFPMRRGSTSRRGPTRFSYATPVCAR